MLRSNVMSSGDTAERYKIPHGGMFKFVSSANYFGEIVEWWGFALAARFTPASLFFAGFTTMFLVSQFRCKNAFVVVVTQMYCYRA